MLQQNFLRTLVIANGELSRARACVNIEWDHHLRLFRMLNFLVNLFKLLRGGEN